MRLTAVVWVSAWLVGMVLILQAEPYLTVAPAVSWFGLALVGVGSVVAATCPQYSAILTLAVMANALLQLLCVYVPVQVEYATLAGPAVSTATVTAALLVPGPRVAGGLIAGTGGAAAVILSVMVVQTGSAPSGFEMVLDAVLRGVGNGMAVLAATSAVRYVARRADSEAETAAALRAEQVRSTAYRSEADAATRLLHDTFVNTLGVIRVGVPRTQVERLRERCRRDLRLVRDYLNGAERRSVEAGALVYQAREKADVLGLHLEVDASTDPGAGPHVPGPVADAALGVITEALLNVSKHAGTHFATLRVELGYERLVVEVRDRGVGFEGSDASVTEVGARIAARASAAQGTARVESSTGKGTAVLARWPTQEAPPSLGHPARDPAGSPDVVPVDVMRNVTVRSVAWFSLMASVSLLHLLLVGSLAAALAGVALYGLALALVLVSDRGSWVSEWRAVCAAALILPLVLVPTMGTAGCPASGAGGWGLDAAIAVMAAVTLLSASRAAVAVAFGAVTIGALVPFVLSPTLVEACAAGSVQSLLLELGSFGAIVLFRGLLNRMLLRAAGEHERVSKLRTQAMAREARQQVRETTLARVLGWIEPVFASVAGGAVGVDDPAVRAASGRQETALRSVLRIDPDLGALGGVLGDLVLAGCDAGKQVEIRSGEPIPVPAPEALAALSRLLASALESMGTDEVMMVTALEREGGGSVLVVLPSNRFVPQPGDTRPLVESGLFVQHAQGGDQTLVEVTWSSR
jgi:signal transduction histidine kinase